MKKFVLSIAPSDGLTSNTPPKGREFVETVTLLDEEKPLESEHLIVKMSDDWSGRLFPTNTKLTIFTEPTLAGKVREVGDKDTVERSIEASLTDHINSPGDDIPIVPKIFNLDEGLIFHSEPDNEEDCTATRTTGERDSRRDKVTTLSHLRLSALIALPLITILNTSLKEAAGDDEEELTATPTRDREEVNGEKMREGQSSR
jgi:hypothetical protein